MANEIKNDNFLDLAEITYLTAENSRFYRTKNGFPALEAVLPKFGDDLESNADKTPVKQDLGRVFFHRCFPFETPDEYISVLNKDGREYAMIRDLSEMPAEAQEIIRAELDRKYLCPTARTAGSTACRHRRKIRMPGAHQKTYRRKNSVGFFLIRDRFPPETVS